MRDGLYKVVAYDPGGTTGWSVIAVKEKAMYDSSKKILRNIDWWQAGQYEGNEFQLTTQMFDLAIAWDDAKLVVEDFLLRKFSTDRSLLSPARIAARFDDRLKVAGDPRAIIYQNPDLALRSITDDRLKLLGNNFWTTLGAEKNIHARESVKHGITWLRRAKEQIARNAATKVEEDDD